MNLRDFLGQREQELTEQIAELHGKIAPLETDLGVFQETKVVVNRPIRVFRAGESACNDPLAEYASSPASNALREFVMEHEQKLTAKISDLHAKLTPLEAELAEVRRAKGAIGMMMPAPRSEAPLVEMLVGVTRIARVLGAAQKRASEILQADQAGHSVDVPAALPPPSPYANLTMKELVVKVLAEHFHEGATTRQMLEFFRDAWGRDIERTNLSPQISRLRQEGIIGRSGAAKWYLIPEQRRGKKPYTLPHPLIQPGGQQLPAGHVFYLSPSEVTEHHIPVDESIPGLGPDQDADDIPDSTNRAQEYRVKLYDMGIWDNAPPRSVKAATAREAAETICGAGVREAGRLGELCAEVWRKGSSQKTYFYRAG
jgi:prefoldin subunit 5